MERSLARHVEQSLILSLDDDPSTQNVSELIALTLDSAKLAAEIELREISSRLPSAPWYPEIWPGEHYRFLAGLMRVLRPKCVVEIGTGSGLSALSMLRELPPDGKLVSFDPIHWKDLPGSVLRESDFASGQFHFSQDDLTDPLLMTVYHGLLGQTDVIFIDAAKDGTMEHRLLANLATIPFEKPPLLVFDDIRLMNMIPLWRSIRRPKLDITSFGHWSGTGLVRWT